MQDARRKEPVLAFLPQKGRMGMRRNWRDSASSTVMTELVPRLGLSGSVVVVDDDTDTVATELRALTNVTVVPWHRRALHGHAAYPWIPQGKYDAAFLRYPGSHRTFDMLLHATGSRLAPQGRLFTYGANDEGIKSVTRSLRDLFEEVEVVDTRKHCRVLCAKHPKDVVWKASLETWRESVDLLTPFGNLKLMSYPSLFAHGVLDKGTELLLKAVPTLPKKARILDYGCGIGIIGIALHQANPGVAVDMIDVDALATHAAQENAPFADVFTADSLGVVSDRAYDFIVSNPPIHSGKGEDFQTLLHIVHTSPAVLKKEGELILVVQATVPLRPQLMKRFQTVEALLQDRQYTVWRCAKAHDI